MSKLKVRILLETRQRGVYATTLLMYEFLKEKGIDVEMYTSFPSNFNVLPPPPKSKIFGEETMLNSTSYSKRVLNEINPEKSSILHIANAWHGIIPLAEKRGVKTVITIQYWWPTCYFNSMTCNDCDCETVSKVSKAIRSRKSKSLLTSTLEAFYAIRKMERIKKNVSSASAILAISKVVKDVLISRGFPEEKLKVINISALTKNTDYVPYTPNDKFFTFAYFGYPDREKGIFNLLEAFAIALRKNSYLRLKVIGGLESKQVVEIVKNLKLTERVILTEWVPYEEFVKKMREILSDVDVVIVPSLIIEAWGRVVTESMLSGRPVLVTKGNGGLVEQVTDGVDGFHVNTYDVKEFAEALYKISLIPREEIKKMGERARANALVKFNPDKIISNLITLYKELSED
ncbi:glycosyltransferase family 4 protein [Saccharolobus islandicus]|uniref:Glycosyl transferase, group 1 n=1 Tax=Saccharolobus islandicus (strain L.D.8.5 / Lassen \|nr:glycosyltransferase family 4 protein [Sulfolobus islandicus]ADB86772.1 glycosyl transferase, group 1 [Sulfolobus islandicus L.D.8.5]